MNSRCSSILYIFSIAGILLFISLFSLHVQPALAQDPITTPTYDPLAQPELPENPTDLEMGRYLFWRHCMPCHGDVGQGLTDDFRALWEDHANCWDRGCHGNKREDEGFPIPTVIPAIVTADHLNQFASDEELFAFLKATHPPQYPGYLKDDEYHDIVKVLFSMNERISTDDNATAEHTPFPLVTFAPTQTASSTPETNQKSTRVPPIAALLCAFFDVVIVVVGLVWARLKSKRNEG